MPQLNAYLNFDGNCAEAMRFYAEVLGAKLEALLTYGQAPMEMQMPPGSENLVMHAYLVHPDFSLMAGDATAGMPYEGIKGVSMTLNYDTPAEAQRVFAALAEGGTVTMPCGPSFWAESFGMLTDRYGVPWIVNGGMKPF